MRERMAAFLKLSIASGLMPLLTYAVPRQSQEVIDRTGRQYFRLMYPLDLVSNFLQAAKFAPELLNLRRKAVGAGSLLL